MINLRCPVFSELLKNIKRYLEEVQGFQERDMLILMDDGRHQSPTKKNIEEAFERMVQYSNAGDVVFIHYSGHGGRVRDLDGTYRMHVVSEPFEYSD